MPKKSNKIGVELSDFHYHEVRDRLRCIMDNIDRQLIQHPVIKLETEVKDNLVEGLETLWKAYNKLNDIE
tara:strand:- start:1319 stop:1528 length:210 start_codon:yes stop_codon:yes gene_type:complete